MLHAVLISLLIAAFAGAGLVNAIGAGGAKSNFVRWGYPSWWHHLTGGLEILTAVLVALPGGRVAGLVLGAAIIAAAALTVVRPREFPHLVPLSVFVVLLPLVWITS